jgi:type II secretory pathway pseudopilin PulG
MPRPLAASRSGYALVWVIVLTAIIAALAAAVAPSLVVVNERSRAVRTAKVLKAISDAYLEFGVDVGNFPGELSMLSNAITTSGRNSCRSAMTAANVAGWATKAPYTAFYTPTSGLWTDIGRLRDSIPARTAPGATPVFAEIPGVSAADAAIFDLVVDNGVGDTVTYIAPVNDTTTVRYRLVSAASLARPRC